MKALFSASILSYPNLTGNIYFAVTIKYDLMAEPVKMSNIFLAMEPAASVSGLYFANPKSSYFSVGKIQRDQVRKKGSGSLVRIRISTFKINSCGYHSDNNWDSNLGIAF